MAYTFSPPGKYFQASTVPVSAPPLTLACWYNLSNRNAQRTMLTIEDAIEQNGWRISTQAGTGAVRLTVRISNTIVSQITTTVGTTINTWTHACVVANTGIR
jgi:hypothetical protein